MTMTCVEKIYIAGSWKNRLLIKHLMVHVEGWKYKITTDWTEHYASDNENKYAVEDMEGIRQCDAFIYCIDGTSSRGKNFELGFAHALNKPIAIYAIVLDHVCSSAAIDKDLMISDMIEGESMFIKAEFFPIFSSSVELRSWLYELNSKLE